jgi:hypothetical protein
MQQGGTTMKKLLATVILFGLGTGLALAGDNNLYAYKTMLQVQSGNYSAHIDQNGGEHFVGR